MFKTQRNLTVILNMITIIFYLLIKSFIYNFSVYLLYIFIKSSSSYSQSRLLIIALIKFIQNKVNKRIEIITHKLTIYKYLMSVVYLIFDLSLQNKKINTTCGNRTIYSLDLIFMAIDIKR